MASDRGDVRPLSAWGDRLRTVCHECRGSGQVSVPDDNGVMRAHSVIVPGDGEVTSAVATVGGIDAYVSRPCPSCGHTDEPGWLPGFVVPA